MEKAIPSIKNTYEFAFKNLERLAGNSFFWKFVPFSYFPMSMKERKSKLNIIVLSIQ